MDAQIFKFFPLLVYRSNIFLPEKEKNILIEEIRNMKQNSKNLREQSNFDAWTGDVRGYELLHKNQKFNKLFVEIKKKIIEYLNELSIDMKQIDIYVQRSWGTISNKKENISPHAHLQSHISFAYYLKKNPDDAKIVFYDKEKPNEILPGLFDSKSIKRKKIIKEINLNNAPSVYVDANEGDILIFPSKTIHGTDPLADNNERISLSADISLVSKDSKLLEHILPPLENWKKI
tara:strand:- start:645 stop:1343 length:699 start_codon:yes stop_codon:yes gene_type:complete